MRYSQSFYLDFLGFLSNKFPDFHWESDTYQEYCWWVEGTDLGRKGIITLEELVEDISGYLSLE